jgi:hypothetical protein
MALDIILSSLIHIIIIILAEGILYFNILSKLQSSALDKAVSSGLSNILNEKQIIILQELQNKQEYKNTVSTLIQQEKNFINFQNTKATNNFYKLVSGIFLVILLIVFYLEIVQNIRIEWLNIIISIVFIFIFISVYEVILIFQTILKMQFNEYAILSDIIQQL